MTLLIRRFAVLAVLSAGTCKQGCCENDTSVSSQLSTSNATDGRSEDTQRYPVIGGEDAQRNPVLGAMDARPYVIGGPDARPYVIGGAADAQQNPVIGGGPVLGKGSAMPPIRVEDAGAQPPPKSGHAFPPIGAGSGSGRGPLPSPSPSTPTR